MHFLLKMTGGAHHSAVIQFIKGFEAEKGFHIQSGYRKRKFFLYNGNDNLEILEHSSLRKAERPNLIR